MQEINLLQNKLKDHTRTWETNNRSIVILLALVLVAELVVGGMFFMLTKNAEDSKAKMDAENVTIQRQQAEMEDDLVDAKGFQAQTKNISLLLSTHVGWNELIDSLASTTLKSSRYMSLSTDTSGRMHIEGIAPDYSQLGKLLLALETNENLESVKLVSTAQSTDELAGVLFSMEVIANQTIFLTEE